MINVWTILGLKMGWTTLMQFDPFVSSCTRACRYAVTLLLRQWYLLIVVFRVIIHHIEEPQFVDPPTRAHDPQPIPQLLLLEELLCSRMKKNALAGFSSSARSMPAFKTASVASAPPR